MELKMRLFILYLLVFTVQAHAATDAARFEAAKHDNGALEIVPFEGVQYECKQVGGISFGANAQWAHCHVTRGRWVATIDFLDLYQAQYCLGNTTESCQQTAQVIFANRAYTPDATVLLVRLDEAGTTYSDPMVVNSGDDSVMSMALRGTTGALATQYFVWRANRWATVDAKLWQHDLQADLQTKLPNGTSVRAISAQPDLENMAAEVPLFNTQDPDCCPTGGVVKVAIGLENSQFVVKNLTIQP
jgi:hypothetical protein